MYNLPTLNNFGLYHIAGVDKHINTLASNITLSLIGITDYDVEIKLPC